MMYQPFFTMFDELNQKTVEAAGRLARINAGACQKAINNQAKAIDLCVDAGVKQAALVREFKNPAAYLSAQGELVKEYADLAQTAATDSLDVLSEVRDALKQWFQPVSAQADSGGRKTG